jgi:tetratricopeptide (TPR) repeat protein
LDKLGKAYHAIGQLPEAQKAYQQALEIDPQDAFLHNNLAEVYLDSGQLEEAIAHFQQRIERQPADALNAHVSLGVIARAQGRESDARQQFEAARTVWEAAKHKRVQSLAGLLENRALLLLGLGREEEAILSLKEALAHRRPSDSIEFTHYKLLAQAPNPPPGLTPMIHLLEEAVAAEAS